MKQTIIKRIENLEKRVLHLEKSKEDKKVYGEEEGKPVTKEDLLKCETCGKNILKCRCD